MALGRSTFALSRAYTSFMETEAKKIGLITPKHFWYACSFYFGMYDGNVITYSFWQFKWFAIILSTLIKISRIVRFIDKNEFNLNILKKIFQKIRIIAFYDVIFIKNLYVFDLSVPGMTNDITFLSTYIFLQDQCVILI